MKIVLVLRNFSIKWGWSCLTVLSGEPRLIAGAALRQTFMNQDVALIRLSDLGVTESICASYALCGIHTLYPWQAECLRLLLPPSSDTVDLKQNLVYSSPTSGGKTLVSELLLLSHLLGFPLRFQNCSAPLGATIEATTLAPDNVISRCEEKRRRIGLFVVPYVSTLKEKEAYFKKVFSKDVRLQTFHQKSTLSVERAVELLVSEEKNERRFDVALCTVEKAHAFVYGLAAVGRLTEFLCVIIVDEVHHVFEQSDERGTLLNVMLSTVVCFSAEMALFPPTQIVGMSATLKDINAVGLWLHAKVFQANYRPIPLKEFLVCNNKVFRLHHHHHSEINNVDFEDSETNPVSIDEHRSEYAKTCRGTPFGLSCCSCCSLERDAFFEKAILCNHSDSFQQKVQNNMEPSIRLAALSYLDGFNTIVFCPSKRSTEQTSCQIIRLIDSLLKRGNITWSPTLQRQRQELQKRMDRISVTHDMAQDDEAQNVSLIDMLTYGVAYHHSGLCIEQRSTLEQAFRAKTLMLLCATSTIATGVNLPAQRVILKEPYIATQLISNTWYKQMAGRAGRAGATSSGEVFVCCSQRDSPHCELVMKGLERRGEMRLTSNISIKNPNNKASNDVLCRSSPLLRFFLEAIIWLTNISYATSEGEDTNMATSDAPQGVHLDTLHRIAHFVLLPNQRDGYTLKMRSSTNSVCFCSSSVEFRSKSFMSTFAASSIATLVHINQVIYTTCAQKYVMPTLQGKAVAASGLDPVEGYLVYVEVDQLANGLILDSELHLAYLCCPKTINVHMNWDTLYLLVGRMKGSDRRSLERLGIDLSVLSSYVANRRVPVSVAKNERLLSRYNRLYAALLCVALIRASPIEAIVRTFHLARGDIQHLQATIVSYGTMTKRLVAMLGWWTLEAVLDIFLPLLQFGTSRDYIALMKIPKMSLRIARVAHHFGLRTVEAVASASIAKFERCLAQSGILRGRKGNVGRLLAEATVRNARKYIAKNRSSSLDLISTSRRVSQEEKSLSTLSGPLAHSNGWLSGSAWERDCSSQLPSDFSTREQQSLQNSFSTIQRSPESYGGSFLDEYSNKNFDWPLPSAHFLTPTINNSQKSIYDTPLMCLGFPPTELENTAVLDQSILEHFSSDVLEKKTIHETVDALSDNSETLSVLSSFSSWTDVDSSWGCVDSNVSDQQLDITLISSAQQGSEEIKLIDQIFREGKVQNLVPSRDEEDNVSEWHGSSFSILTSGTASPSKRFACPESDYLTQSVLEGYLTPLQDSKECQDRRAFSYTPQNPATACYPGFLLTPPFLASASCGTIVYQGGTTPSSSTNVLDSSAQQRYNFIISRYLRSFNTASKKSSNEFLKEQPATMFNVPPHSLRSTNLEERTNEIFYQRLASCSVLVMGIGVELCEQSGDPHFLLNTSSCKETQNLSSNIFFNVLTLTGEALSIPINRLHPTSDVSFFKGFCCAISDDLVRWLDVKTNLCVVPDIKDFLAFLSLSCGVSHPQCCVFDPFAAHRVLNIHITPDVSSLPTDLALQQLCEMYGIRILFSERSNRSLPRVSTANTSENKCLKSTVFQSLWALLCLSSVLFFWLDVLRLWSYFWDVELPYLKTIVHIELDGCHVALKCLFENSLVGLPLCTLPRLSCYNLIALRLLQLEGEMLGIIRDPSILPSLLDDRRDFLQLNDCMSLMNPIFFPILVNILREYRILRYFKLLFSCLRSKSCKESENSKTKKSYHTKGTCVYGEKFCNSDKPLLGTPNPTHSETECDDTAKVHLSYSQSCSTFGLMLCPELFYFDVMSDHFSFQFPARLSMAFLLPHIKRYGRLRAFFQPFLSTECCSCENVSLTQLPIVWVIVSVLNLCAAKGSASHWFTFGRLASIHKVADQTLPIMIPAKSTTNVPHMNEMQFSIEVYHPLGLPQQLNALIGLTEPNLTQKRVTPVSLSGPGGIFKTYSADCVWLVYTSEVASALQTYQRTQCVPAEATDHDALSPKILLPCLPQLITASYGHYILTARFDNLLVNVFLCFTKDFFLQQKLNVSQFNVFSTKNAVLEDTVSLRSLRLLCDSKFDANVYMAQRRVFALSVTFSQIIDTNSPGTTSECVTHLFDYLTCADPNRRLIQDKTFNFSRFFSNFQTSYTKASSFIVKASNLIEKQGFVSSPLGRRLYIFSEKRPNGIRPYAAASALCNAAAADIIKLAAGHLRQLCRLSELIRLTLITADAFHFEVTTCPSFENIKTQIRSIMNKASYQVLGETLDVTFYAPKAEKH